MLKFNGNLILAGIEKVCNPNYLVIAIRQDDAHLNFSRYWYSGFIPALLLYIHKFSYF